MQRKIEIQNKKKNTKNKHMKKGGDIPKMKSKELKIKRQDRKNRGITLIALVVTIIVSYDKMKKYSNINSFLFSKN